MNGKLTLYLDQYGNKWFAHTVKELREAIGGGAISKMYRDTKSAGTVHVGYVVGAYWCEAFQPVRRAA